MSVEEAKAALALAPRSGSKFSRVEPNMLQYDAVRLTELALEKYPPTAIGVTPAMARKIAAVVQDCIDPVELRFHYYSAGEGTTGITVGWNREEVDIRNGLKPRHVFGPAMFEEQQRRVAELQRQISQSRQQGTYPPTAEFLARVDAKVRAQFAPVAPTPTPPAPPKPDPASPTFVLKRPKPSSP